MREAVRVPDLELLMPSLLDLHFSGGLGKLQENVIIWSMAVPH
jgi:hypothetical protein